MTAITALNKTTSLSPEDQSLQNVLTTANVLSFLSNGTEGILRVASPGTIAAGTTGALALGAATAARGVIVTVAGVKLYLKNERLKQEAAKIEDSEGVKEALAMQTLGGGLAAVGTAFSASAAGSITPILHGKMAALATKVGAVGLKALYGFGYATFALVTAIGGYRLGRSKKFQRELQEKLTEHPMLEQRKAALVWLKNQVKTDVGCARLERRTSREAVEAVKALEGVDSCTDAEAIRILDLVQKGNFSQQVVAALFILSGLVAIAALVTGQVFVTGPYSSFLFVGLALIFLPIDNAKAQKWFVEKMQKFVGPEELLSVQEMLELAKETARIDPQHAEEFLRSVNVSEEEIEAFLANLQGRVA